MKVHNLGNDYAYQRKQKQMENQSAEKSNEKPAISDEANAGDQVQNRGERETMAAADTSAPKQKSKKKKEAGTENEQQED